MKQNRTKRNYKKNGSVKRKNKKGGCGCTGNASSTFAGGAFAEQAVLEQEITGGSSLWNTTANVPTPGLSQLSNTAYYPLNSENYNPNYGGIASRQTENYVHADSYNPFFTGGRRGTRSKRSYKRSAKRHGAKNSRGTRINRKHKKHGGQNLTSQVVGALQNTVSGSVTGVSTYMPSSLQQFTSTTPFSYSLYSSSNPPIA
jgi:hypothetical protein